MTFAKRSTSPEWMDEGRGTSQETDGAYALIALVNRWLGGTRAVLFHLDRFSRGWSRREPIDILDAGTGGADIPVEVIRWARRRRFRVRVTALDQNAPQLKRNRERYRNHFPEIRWLCGDMRAWPIRNRGFDYVIASIVFHHLPENGLHPVLSLMNRTARRGIIVNDLIRCRAAYCGIRVLSFFARNRLFRNDAPLSVLRAFSATEVRRLAGGFPHLGFRRHFAFRFTLAGEKP